MLNDLVNKYPLRAIADKEREYKEILLMNEHDKDLLIEREKTKQKQIELKLKMLNLLENNRITQDIMLKIMDIG